MGLDRTLRRWARRRLGVNRGRHAAPRLRRRTLLLGAAIGVISVAATVPLLWHHGAGVDEGATTPGGERRTPQAVRSAPVRSGPASETPSTMATSPAAGPDAAANPPPAQLQTGGAAALRLRRSGQRTAAGTAPAVPRSGAAAPGSALPDGGLLFGFESGTESWTGGNLRSAPRRDCDWSSESTCSLSADINAGPNGQYWLARTTRTDLSDFSTLRATVRAESDAAAVALYAKLYIKVGSTWRWVDDGAEAVSSADGGTELELDLTDVDDSDDVREIGVQFLTPANSPGVPVSVYVDDVRLDAS